MEGFRIGIQRTEETISSSIATKLEWDRLGRAEELRTKKQTSKHQYTLESEDDSDVEVEPRKKRIDTSSDRKDKDKFLLEGLYDDKIFLLSLQSERVMMEASDGSVGVLIEEALEYLSSRSEFWAVRQSPQAPKSRPASARTYSRPHSAVRRDRPQSASVVLFHDSESTMISRYVRPGSATVRSRPQSAVERLRPQSAAVERLRPQSAAVERLRPQSASTSGKLPSYARTTSASSKKSSVDELGKTRPDSGIKMICAPVPATVKERFEEMKRVYLGDSFNRIEIQ
jgi:hypothetical protein